MGVRYHMLMEIPVTRGEGVPGDNGGARQHDGRRDEIAGGQGLLQQHQRQKRPHEGWSPDCPSKDNMPLNMMQGRSPLSKGSALSRPFLAAASRASNMAAVFLFFVQ